jgi:cellulose biosynthesis protein BcsQ
VNVHPLVVAFVSGKGGVGKTMLAVAFAKETSVEKHTLLLDLDFFNRGLTGLMPHGRQLCGIDPPTFLSQPQDEWKLEIVAPNLSFVRYADLSPLDMNAFATSDVALIAAALSVFIQRCAELCGAEIVVVDCHGGPDNSSFAACAVSDYSLLVSEPDKITFFGTMNFLRQMKRTAPIAVDDLFLVFNKVVPAFSAAFLRALYRRYVRPEFGEKPLLAIFPLEVYLTKEFERTPFLTAVFPHSLLSQKTRVLVADLLGRKHPSFVPRSISAIPKLLRSVIRSSLGKVPAVLNTNVVLACIAIVALLLTATSFLSTNVYEERGQLLRADILRAHIIELQARGDTSVFEPREAVEVTNFLSSASSYVPSLIIGRRLDIGYYESYGDSVSNSTLARGRRSVRYSAPPLRIRPEYRAIFERIERLPIVLKVALWMDSGIGYIAGGGLLWVIIALLFNWTRDLDRNFTYEARRHRFSRACIYLMSAISIWLSAVLLWKVVLGSDELELPFVWVFAVLGLSFGSAVLFYEGSIAIYDLRYGKRWRESGLRLLFCFSLLVFVVTTFLTGKAGG